MVNEFPEVFSDDLLGVPPDREIEFGIDFVSNTHLIFIPSYRTALAELRELKGKYKDYLDKGFIHPSVSAWGALVFFMHKKDSFLWICIEYRKLNKVMSKN